MGHTTVYTTPYFFTGLNGISVMRNSLRPYSFGFVPLSTNKIPLPVLTQPPASIQESLRLHNDGITVMSNSLNPYSFSTSGLSKGGQEVGMYGRVSVGGFRGDGWGIRGTT